MKYLVSPSNQALGEILVPGDKSISHRAIMLASIAEGRSTIKGFLESEDCIATLNAFKKMGVDVECSQHGELLITGLGKHGLQAPPSELDLGNSGTSMRLLAGLLCGQGFAAELIGDASLMSRPMQRICDPLKQMGADIEISSAGTPPIVIKPIKNLTAISYKLPVASAQVKSAILLASLYAQGITQVIELKPTRDHTERMLQSFAYPIDISSEGIFIEGTSQLLATDIQVPTDISSAAFFIVAACIASQGAITLHNVGINPTRTGILEILKAMNADIEVHNQLMFGGEPVASITARGSSLRGIDIPPELVPAAIDEFPIICIAAACAEGVTRITQAEELRVKESDRIAQMAKGLQTLGIDVEEFADGLSIHGGKIKGGCIASGDDHRIVMAFSVASLRAQSMIEILDCENVATSFPGFVETACSVGLKIDVIH